MEDTYDDRTRTATALIEARGGDRNAYASKVSRTDKYHESISGSILYSFKHLLDGVE